MNKLYYYFLLFSFSSLLFAGCKKEEVDLSKGFIKYFGGIDVDDASEVQQTGDGGYIIIGTTSSEGKGGADMYVLKTDSRGNEEWHKTYGDTLDDFGSSVHYTSDGGYVFAGTFRYIEPGIDSNKTDVYVVKTNSSGDTLWTKKYGYSGFNEQGISIRQTSDGGYIIAGNTDATNDGDMVVIKTNSLGVQQAFAIHPSSPTPGLDESINILQRNDGGYLLSSYSASLSGPRLAFINQSPISSSSNAPSKNDFFEPTMNIAGEVALTNDGNYVLTGNTTGDDVFVLKFQNTNANPKIWFKTYPGSGLDIGNSIQATSDGGYIVLGSTSSKGAGSRDMYLFKINSTGDMEWDKTFGGAGFDLGKVVRKTADGGYIILGTMEFGDDPSNKDNIICLIKVNEKGEIGN